jgi:hypothetical protein
MSCRIRDNGSGMNQSELEEAMRLGTDTTYEEKDLGKFGMGMKTASLSNCNILTVISKRKRSEICGYQWDIGHVKKKGWTLLQLTKKEIAEILKAEKFSLDNSGTIILWDDTFWLDEQLQSYDSDKVINNYHYRLVEGIKLHLGMVYHRFLDGTLGRKNMIQLVVNGDKVKPWDPFCRDEASTREISFKKEVGDYKIEGYRNPVKIRAWIVPAKEAFSSEDAWKLAKGLLPWNDSQGYYIYRANRIIRFGGWHGTRAKDEHNKLARVSIDIDSHLDQLFRITVNKTRVQFPEVLFQHLKNVVNPLVVKKAKTAYSKSDERLTIKNNFRKSETLIKEVAEELLQQNRIKSRNFSNGEKGSIQVNNPNGTWLSNKIIEFLKYGTSNDFEIVSDNLKEDVLWKIVCDDNSKFKVIVNAAHPFCEKFYTVSNNKSVTDALDALIFSLAFAELYNKNNKTAELFDTFKSVSSKALKRIMAKETI